MAYVYQLSLRLDNILTVCYMICVIVSPVLCNYKVPSQVDLHRGSTATSSNGCRDNQACESRYTETRCKDAGFCTLRCQDGSRTGYPSLTPLTSTSECTDDGQIQSPPPAADASNGNFFTNSTVNTDCLFNRSVNAHTTTKNFGISFWIRGECPNSCTVLRIGPITVTLENNAVKVNLLPSARHFVTTTNWTHILVTKRSGNKLELFKNGVHVGPTVTVTVTNPLETSMGPTTAPTGADTYTVVDARFYNDGLTKREIQALYNSTFPTAIESNCRCPVEKPDMSTDGLQCSMAGGGNTQRLKKIYNEPSAMLDGNSSTSWASQENSDVTVTVDLGNSFQITEVTVSFHSSSSTPTDTSWKFHSRGKTQQVDSNLYNTDVSELRRTSTTIGTYSQYEKTLAEQIEIMFTRKPGGYIITDIVISGRCDCDGSATRCSKASGSPTYNCFCQSNTMQPNCRTCVNRYYRKEEEFGCPTTCSCNTNGVANISDMCQSVGGQCKCKTNVQGRECDTCKRLTYNLDGNNSEGCTRSNCSEDGTDRCDKNNGTCFCRNNVQGVNCDSCTDKHYGIQSKTGCSPCDCNTVGTSGARDGCHLTTGQCTCKDNVNERQCDQCKDMYHSLDANNSLGCTPCGCNRLGTQDMVCNKTTGQCACRGDDFYNKQCKPVVDTPVPSFGPIGGSTIVTITGHYLNKQPAVLLGTEVQNIIDRSDTTLTVETKPVSATTSVALIVRSGSEEIGRYNYSYKENPTLGEEGIPKNIKSARSGGCNVAVTGTNLNSVYQPKMTVTIGTDQLNMTVCKHMGVDGRTIFCPTPPMDSGSGSNGTVRITLDGATQTVVASFTVTEDAVVNPLTKTVDFAPPFEKKLTISGESLGTDCNKEDYLVYIGAEGYPCEVTSFTETQIECEPPQDPPDPAPKVSERMYKIVVRIGTREITVGEIYYRQFWLTTYFVYIMVGAGFFLIAIIVICICICCCRCRRNRRRRHMPTSAQSEPTTLSNISNGRNSEIPLITPTIKPIITPFENPSYNPDPDPKPTPNAEEVVTMEYFLHRVEESIRSNVKDSLIGEQSFTKGTICTAKGQEARLIDGSFTSKSKIQPNQKITIKMPIKKLPESGVLSPRYTAALRECLRLKPHRDDNVLSMHGIGLDKNRFYIIYPYMEKRTLKDHIAEPNHNFVLRELLEFSLQVCEGMEYLSGRGLVHKDLAMRNCMVDVKDRVRISDAAFSWDFYPDEYMYDEVKDRYLPVRWMAPESLKTGFYDTKSDVWAFGVLMWELLTRGIIPFHELKNEELQDYVEDGYRLGKPQMVSDDIYELMNTCWHSENEYRPTFHTILQQLTSSLTNKQSMNEDLYINSETADSVYINQDEIQRLREHARSKR